MQMIFAVKKTELINSSYYHVTCKVNFVCSFWLFDCRGCILETKLNRMVVYLQTENSRNGSLKFDR